MLYKYILVMLVIRLNIFLDDSWGKIVFKGNEWMNFNLFIIKDIMLVY